MALIRRLRVLDQTGAPLGELACSSISFTSTLSAAGQATFVLPLSDLPTSLSVAVLNQTSAYQVVVLGADGVTPQWGGLVATTVIDLRAGTITLNAEGILSYLNGLAAPVLGAPTAPLLQVSGNGRVALTRSIVGLANSRSGGLTIDTTSFALSLDTTSLNIYVLDVTHTIGGLLTDTASTYSIDFDFTYIAGTGSKLLPAYRPTVVASTATTVVDLVQALPGATIVTDGTSTVSNGTVQVTGGSQGYASVSGAGYAAGLPRDLTIARNDLTDAASLTTAGNQALLRGSTPIVVPQFSLVGDGTGYLVGDTIRVVCRTPVVFDALYRITQKTVNLTPTSQTVQLTLATAAVFS